MKIRLSIFTLMALSSLSAQEVILDSISVTATKISTKTKDISQSIAVVDEKTIEDKNVLNIQDAIGDIPGVIAESSTNSPSPRLIIRGAGLKARYGVREIMIMKDGVPMTDPDSFTRFDFIDMQDVSSVEVQKGPGSINAVNATGGVIQLVTKSVFKDDKNRIKVGAGNDNQRNVNLKLRGALSKDDFVAFTFSKRTIDNSWRDHNKFDSTQATLKYGHMFEDDSTFETEFSYTESNMELPASMTASEFETFKNTGSQHNTSDQWQNSGRDSKIFSINAKYEKEVGSTTFKPRVYFNTWEHFHPVTGMINDSNDNSVYGTDLELNNLHKLFGQKATFVAGVTLKADITNGAKKYKYADYETKVATSWPFAPYISKTLSDNKGALAQTEDSKTILYGGYLMETFSPSNDFIIDVSTRVDELSFDISGNEVTAYSYSLKNYTAGKGLYNVDKSYTLFSAKLGAVYKITDTTNMYASVATANQAPTTSELGENEQLNMATSVNYEIGLKTRAKNISADIAIYQNDVDDEIIQIKDANGNSIYDNAGKTQKRGLEVTAVYKPIESVQLGANYAFSEFKFIKFSENVGSSSVSRDGNYLPYIPKNQYSLFATYNMKNGFKSRVTTKTWGKYYMDNANTQEYDGYQFVTDIMLGYEKDAHNIQLNINNITNQYYAMEALKDVYGNESYKAAAPINGMLTYIYKF
ncbi:TonB-dependent receptor protein [Sulfurimonas gotlandica GD1]|uniref:TonB-dependent receptor protein n=1 Tax=Sulfurimonas gotlandica (strain DSM 19862 / JCM 16533 / GD1) TaxID=929558 RepID=B6BJY1_SULGG|nr:TonB-dependent receptor [Sulfurimonas gotlandica]EDZ62658.1 TonB-dependent receptor [Sulfurimonas gotlandica GD1]EHP31384.1 TonB-dependent receptor protein [Sulfurimonas gotlandica GD1]